MTTLILIAAWVSVACLSDVINTSNAYAVQSVPYQMNFQGRLNNASGAPMATGTYNMVFRIYSAATGGSALWTETRAVSAGQGVSITSGGLFSVQLGSVTSLPSNIFNTSSPLYLEVELPSPATATTTSPSWTEGPMGPRNPIVSSPFAVNSDLLDGLDSSAFAAASGSTGYIQNQGASPQAANFNITGNGTIGGKLLTPSIDSTGLLAIGTSTATGLTLGRTGANTTVNGGNILLGGNTTVTAGNTLSVQSGYAAITGFNIADSHATLTIDNHSSGASPLVVQSTDTTVFEVKNDGTVVASNTIKASALQAASLDTSSAGTLTLGSTNATSITLGSSTTTNITLGSGSNTVTFTAGGGLIASGTARHTKTILLTPEYAGAVLDAASDSTCSAANSGTMTSGFDSTNRMNYYNWSSTSASAQCYDVVVQVPIPSDFNGWSGTPDIRLSKDSTGTATYAIAVIDSTGTTDTNYNYSAPGTLSTSWANMATSVFGNNAGTNGTTSYVPGGYFTIKIRVSSTSSANVKLGNIKLTYSSTF